jgi:FlaA1/EpsC-like NDP-sugar epimerase
MQSVKPGNRSPDAVLEDLLGRSQTSLDTASLREHIQGKSVLVTGAAGSIGAELCRQIAGCSPLALVGFDQAETPLFQLAGELEQSFPRADFRTELGSVTRSADIGRAMKEYRPAMVFHAAAYKHVPMMERHAFAAVENNVFGTLQVAEAAARGGVESFVLISTDKAVRPASVLGVTKRVAEMTICALQKRQGTRFIAVRFGNVLGSNGSVVPLFKQQIEAGGPVTVTHPEMRRYFMTASEAGQLVLQASVLGKGGEIFILDMGEPVKIVDLARNLITASGLDPDRDIEIEFTGIRAGEKLFEELNFEDEQLSSTAHPKINSVVRAQRADGTRVMELLHQLKHSVDARNSPRMILLLKELVPDFTPGTDLLSDAMSSGNANNPVEDCEPACNEVGEGEPESALATNEEVFCAARGRS